MTTQLEAPPQRKRQLDVCPWCGQELLDHDAVHHVEESERKYERELEIAANAKAEQLATELTEKKDAQLERLQQQLTEEQDKLTEERARHAEALRDQKAKLRDDAEREAAKKVRADLLKKERLITGLKEQIDEQSRRIEHLTADERGEMNE
jgi:DNA repair exonuclease SbcCD ATPase subunit